MQTTIHLEIRRLIEAKSKRDHMNFTSCQLAQALGMPRSMITKLTHTDESKRVTNPRIETLMKIVEFFRADGFSVTLEDLLGLKTREISVRDQLIPANQPLTVPIYSLHDPRKKLGKVTLNIFVNHTNVLGFRTNKDIKPFFKIGSLFIIDQEAKLEDDVLIAIKSDVGSEIDIKRYKKNKHKITLESLDPNEKSISLFPTSQVEILGVVIQINAPA